MAAVHEPKPVRYSQLIELHRITRSPVSGAVDIYPCSHYYYPSIESFAEHILWFLQQTKPSGDASFYHYEVIKTLLYRYPLCDLCRCLLISAIPIAILVSESQDQGIESIEDFLMWRNNISLLLLGRVFVHPKITKFMNKVMTNSMEDFKSVCNVLDSLVYFKIFEPDDCHFNEYFEISWTPFTRAFLLSIKYWKIEQMDYFLRNHCIKFQRSGFSRTFPFGPQAEVEVAGRERVEMVVDAIMKVVVLRIQFMAKLDISSQYHWFRKINIVLKKDRRLSIKHLQNKAKLELLSDIGCSWTKCREKQRTDKDWRLKLCGGCKMTYYCSRSCQKRAWPWHKDICHQLCKLCPS